ncbi:MAG: 2-C-methyl-D-erythritol 2,4-cyclodiphosphate synthase, partial [bacterium]
MGSFKVGFGFDTHKLEEGRPFWLGGVLIDHHKGAMGHSDADVLIHAIIDAMLGAAGLPDIGNQFPDTDPAYKNIDSKHLLKHTFELVRERGYSIGNIDSTVVLQSPKIAGNIRAMSATLAAILG